MRSAVERAAIGMRLATASAKLAVAAVGPSNDLPSGRRGSDQRRTVKLKSDSARVAAKLGRGSPPWLGLEPGRLLQAVDRLGII
jgi:hypothetical protein